MRGEVDLFILLAANVLIPLLIIGLLIKLARLTRYLLLSREERWVYRYRAGMSRFFDSVS